MLVRASGLRVGVGVGTGGIQKIAPKRKYLQASQASQASQAQQIAHVHEPVASGGGVASCLGV